MKWPLPAFLALLLCCFLTACATPQAAEQESLLANIPAGSILTVNRPLTIPANETRATLQFSQQVNLSRLDTWEPYCQLVVRTLSRHYREIPKTNFRIVRVIRDEAPFSSGVNYTWLIKTTMHLESNEHNDIYRLVCGQVWDGATSRRLYMYEFKEAVGDYITIQEETSH